MFEAAQAKTGGNQFVTVSIIVQTQVRPALLRGARESAVHQICRDIEVIAVDDGPAPGVQAEIDATISEAGPRAVRPRCSN